MRIGIDCDGVLRDLIADIIKLIKEKYPKYTEEILIPESWNWEDWLPFWTEEQAEKFIFEDNSEKLFGKDSTPINEALEDWDKVNSWATEFGHKLILVSAQREHCKKITREFLDKNNFNFDEYHFLGEKWSVDVDVLVDDSPEQLQTFSKKSIANGQPICMKRTWNRDSQKKFTTINRLSDLIKII